MSTTTIRLASLDEIKQMRKAGELFVSSLAGQGEGWGPDFCASAGLVEPKQSKSVHLKVDPEVFAFFKAQGKGHLTRMQDVLKAYVRAHCRS